MSKESVITPQERITRIESVIKERDSMPQRISEGKGPYTIEGTIVFEGNVIQSDIAIGQKRLDTLSHIQNHTDTILKPRLAHFRQLAETDTLLDEARQYEAEVTTLSSNLALLKTQFDLGLIKESVYSQYRDRLDALTQKPDNDPRLQKGLSLIALSAESPTPVDESRPKTSQEKYAELLKTRIAALDKVVSDPETSLDDVLTLLGPSKSGRKLTWIQARTALINGTVSVFSAFYKGTADQEQQEFVHKLREHFHAESSGEAKKKTVDQVFEWIKKERPHAFTIVTREADPEYDLQENEVRLPGGEIVQIDNATQRLSIQLLAEATPDQPLKGEIWEEALEALQGSAYYMGNHRSAVSKTLSQVGYTLQRMPGYRPGKKEKAQWILGRPERSEETQISPTLKYEPKQELMRSEPEADVLDFDMSETKEEDAIREKIALVAALIQSKVGTTIQLHRTLEMQFSLTNETYELFEQIFNEIPTTEMYTLPKESEIKKKRLEALAWFAPIYEQYQHPDFVHDNEDVDILAMIMYEIDESQMGNHLLEFLSTPEVTNDANGNKVRRWDAPKEMLQNIRAFEQKQHHRVQENLTQRDELLTPDIISEENIIFPTSHESVSEEPTRVQDDDVKPEKEISSEGPQAIQPEERINPIEKKDPDVRTKLEEDLAHVVSRLKTNQSTVVQISSALNIHVKNVQKIIDQFKLKVQDRKRGIPLYDTVGAIIIEYGKDLDLRKNSLRPDEIEGLKHLAIEIHANWLEEERIRKEAARSN